MSHHALCGHCATGNAIVADTSHHEEGSRIDVWLMMSAFGVTDRVELEPVTCIALLSAPASSTFLATPPDQRAKQLQQALASCSQLQGLQGKSAQTTDHYITGNLRYRSYSDDGITTYYPQPAIQSSALSSGDDWENLIEWKISQTSYVWACIL
ncbi:hypothetical protein K438DRAFT_1759551 [Mycena galopus ATCC 62051]|nr:hypothetical protein K438DRAFT_1759551 [Mycena galopus ATCC 62051]